MTRLHVALVLFLGMLVIAASFFAGAYFGYAGRPEVEKALSVFNKMPAAEGAQEVDFAPFWKAWNVLEEKFAVPSEDEDGVINRQQLLWGAVSGLAKSVGDPYTVFFPPEEKKIFESDIRGDFEGVGMEIGIRKNVLTVVSPLKGTPADRAGIKAGDRIVQIDGESTEDMTVEEAVRRIRGQKGTAVKLTMLRDGGDGPLEIRVIRDTVIVPNIETQTAEGKVFVIKLSSFSERSPQDFRRALREMVDTQQYGLVLDLRNNPGGFLAASVEIASWFLPAGEVVARERFTSGEERLYRSRGDNIFRKLPMVILVNGGSASASEILAGALREHKVAALMGTKTFGKGSIQELVSITDETSLKVTVARWFTPEGHSISGDGLEPDIIVEQKAGDTEELRDTQLEAAAAKVRELIRERSKTLELR